jgi:exoribonuclease R
MQYFKEFNKNIDFSALECGVIKNIDNIQYVNDKVVKNNRALENDEVYILDDEVVGIKNRSLTDIIGILYLDSKVKYGIIKDKSLYLFRPTNKAYSNFYVPYKTILGKSNKVYAIIQFKEWKTTDKLPIGTLRETLGNIGEKSVEIEHLRNYFGIRNNTWKLPNDKVKTDALTIENLQSLKEDYTVFSIDPLGSKDIDDAFHFIETTVPIPFIEVGIHIASPVKFFEDYFEDVMCRVSSVYTDIENYNLLPKIYSENYVSLIESTNKYSISLILKIVDNKVDSYSIRESIVRNIKNYTYDDFDNTEFMEFSKKFFHSNDICTHKLVENWMILANQIIAKELIDRNVENQKIVLRTHQMKVESNIEYENEYENEYKYKDDNDRKLIDYLNLKGESSALYKIYDVNDTSNQKHSKLGNQFYTHFTSPIRRAIDFYIHMLLLDKEVSIQQEQLDKINTFTKNARRFDRHIKRLSFLHSINKFDSNIVTYAYIIEINNYKLKVYIPEYNLEESIIIVPKKFKEIAEINISDKKDKIICKIDDLEMEYSLYQKMNIKLWVFQNEENIYDKLKIEIISLL